MKKPVVGQVLCAVWVGGRRWRSEEDLDRKEVVVTKVGRKYFEVSGVSSKFYIEDWREVYEYGSADWRLYESEQAYIDSKELFNLCDEFRLTFGGYGFPRITLDQAKRIKMILDESK